MKILVASHKELRDQENNKSIELSNSTAQQQKTWKNFWFRNNTRKKQREKIEHDDDDGNSESDSDSEVVPIKSGQKIAKQVNSIDYIESNPQTGEACLKVFQRVITEIQMIESNPFYSMQTYQGPKNGRNSQLSDSNVGRSALSQFKESTKRMLKGVNSLQ